MARWHYWHYINRLNTCLNKDLSEHAVALQKGKGNFKLLYDTWSSTALSRKSNTDTSLLFCPSCAIKTAAECSHELVTLILKFIPSLIASCSPFSTRISLAITIHTYGLWTKEKNIIQRNMRKYLLWEWDQYKWLTKTETMTKIRILFTLLRIGMAAS